NFDGTWLSSLSNPNDHSCWPLNQAMLPALMCPSAPHQGGPIGGDGLGPTAHWMAGAPTDYAFSHGADMIRAVSDYDADCPGGLLHYWAKYPKHARGLFGYSSNCMVQQLRHG